MVANAMVQHYEAVVCENEIAFKKNQHSWRALS